MTNYQQQWIKILDRRFHLVSQAPEDDFWLELAQFLDSILYEEPFRPYSARLQREFAEWLENYQRLLAEEVETARQIRRELVVRHPELDDSSIPQPEIDADRMGLVDDDPYFQSLAYFDFRAERVRENGVRMWPGSGRFDEQDPTEALLLIGLLTRKILSLPNEQIPEDLFLQLQHLRETHTQLRNEFIGNCRVWPPAALEFLLGERRKINPAPRQFATIAEWSYAQGNRTLQNMINVPPNPQFCHMLLRRVYERIRADLGTHLAHYELIQKYKARCMFYDRERLNSLAVSTTTQREDTLTRDLALFLFDNGLSTYYRTMQGIHEYDLIAPSVIIEAKAYNDNEHRRYLIRGISQLYAYANGLETDTRNVRELYYVIFRLDGGPLYDWPERIEMNRWVIYPITIDLGSSLVSGSRQSRVRPITREEIYEIVKAG